MAGIPRQSRSPAPSSSQSPGGSEHDYRLHIERFVAQVTRIFLNVPPGGLPERIFATLKMLGEFADVDRCYVFDLDESGTHLIKRQEWDAPGVASMGPDDEAHPVSTWPWAWPLLAAGQVVRVERLDALPPEASDELRRWRDFQLRSLLVVPTQREGRIQGAFGFESLRKENAWTDGDVGLLSTVAEVFGQAYARHRAEERMQELLRRARQQQAALGALAVNETIAAGILEPAFRAIAKAAAEALEVAQVGIWLLDADGRLLRCAVSYTTGDGRYSAGHELVAADYPAYFAALRAGRAIDASDAAADPRTREFGEGYLREQNIASMLDATVRLDGKVVGVVCHEHRGRPRTWTADEISFAGNVADLTAHALLAQERRRALQAMLEAKEAAEASNRAKSEFLANMSHEIRTPLNSIIGGAALLSSSLLDADGHEMVSMIQRSGEALLALVEDLLDFAKIEAGQLRIQPAPMDLARTVDEAVEALGLMAQEKGLRLDLAWDEGAPRRVVGDAHRIRQVVTNLIANALKFTARGGVTVAVSSPRREGTGARVRVEVRDTGIGVPPAERERIFQKFTQVDGSAARRFGGTGLGLAICRELVDLMGGAIGVESEVGRGSTFWFELPLALAPAAPAVRGEAEPAPSAGDSRAETAFAGLRVLLAEDNPFNQRVAIHMLQRLGCAVDVAANGFEALALHERHAYDVVLMDCQMPEMDGYAATATLRQREAGRERTPIVALTAHALAEDRERCLAAGMDDFLTKPLRRETLQAALGRWAPAPAAR